MIKKVNLIILEKLLSKSQDQNIKDFIIIMDPKPKKKNP